MQIDSTSNNITINGNIKSTSDFSDIKNIMESMITQHKSITINIVDSLSITSSVIGYFNKIILRDKINISMNIGNEQLLTLIDDLGLSTTFKTKKL